MGFVQNKKGGLLMRTKKDLVLLVALVLIATVGFVGCSSKASFDKSSLTFTQGTTETQKVNVTLDPRNESIAWAISGDSGVLGTWLIVDKAQYKGNSEVSIKFDATKVPSTATSAVLKLTGPFVKNAPEIAIVIQPGVTTTAPKIGLAPDSTTATSRFHFAKTTDTLKIAVYRVAAPTGKTRTLSFEVQTPSWLKASVATGDITDTTAAGAVPVTITPQSLPAATDAEVTVVGKDAGTVVGSAKVFVTTKTDYLTEVATQADVAKLQKTQITFNADGTTYTAARTPVTAFPVDPESAAPVNFAGNAFVAQTSPQPIPFYGKDYTNYYVGTQGYVTFEAPGASTGTLLGDHFAAPGITALSSIDASLGGTVTTQNTPAGDGVAITYQNVPNEGTTKAAGPGNSIQIIMYFLGYYEIVYLNLNPIDGTLLGLSDGAGIPADFVGSQFNAFATGSVKAALGF